jgi:hypothetical protein
MCKCVVGILLADFITISLLYTAFIELNISDDRYNIIKLFNSAEEFEGKFEAMITMGSYLIALIVHSLAVIIKWVYQIICCCECCCCRKTDGADGIYYGNL